MYYLTFLWPDVQARLEKHGLRAVAKRGTCAAPYTGVIIVVATKK